MDHQTHSEILRNGLSTKNQLDMEMKNEASVVDLPPMVRTQKLTKCQNEAEIMSTMENREHEKK
jgi:hypothetical protein